MLHCDVLIDAKLLHHGTALEHFFQNFLRVYYILLEEEEDILLYISCLFLLVKLLFEKDFIFTLLGAW